MELSLASTTLTRSWFTRPTSDSQKSDSVAAPSSGSDSVSIGPRQTEALLPASLDQVSQQAPNQEVSGAKDSSQESSTDQLRVAADKANKYMKMSNTYLTFEVSNQTGHVVVSVINSETKEVVRSIPPETLNRIADRSSQLQGLLFEASG